MKITPLDIQQQVFKKSFFSGYECAEVDEFLDLVKAEFEQLVVESNSLKDELRRLTSQVSEFQSREKILQDTMVTAQKITEDIKSMSKKEGELIISQAAFQADKIIRAAQDRLGEIIDDINELKRQRVMFESSIRSLVDKHYKLLEITSEDEVKDVPFEDKISIFPRS